MNSKEIFSNLSLKAVNRNHFFGRDLLVVKYVDFSEYEYYFEQSFNLFNRKLNLRTLERFKHIHAIKTGDVVEIHFDYGNVSKLFLVGHISHFLIDVIPYFLWHLIKMKRPYSI